MQDWHKLYLELKEQADKVEKLLQDIVSENNSLKSKVTALAFEIKDLKASNTKLTTENNKLKDRLGLNSKNSSIPTSKELYKIKQETKKQSSKKQGAQIGHKANVRDAMKADKIIEVNLDSTKCECGGYLSDNGMHAHQKIDIPEIKPIVTEYHLQKARCRKCGKRQKASLPTGVGNDLFGPNVKTIIGSLTGFYKNSKRDVTNILNDLFNLQISVGSVSNNEGRIAEKCTESYEDIELELSYSKMLHIDETSLTKERWGGAGCLHRNLRH